MVWGAMSTIGVSELKVLEGKQDRFKYIETLQSNSKPFLAKVKTAQGGVDPIFQQDGASIHTARDVKRWLDAEGITTMDWPAKSPDLNPIENLWGDLVLSVYDGGRQFANKEDLRRQIMKSWAAITEERVQHLLASMPGRMADVLLCKGKKIDK